MSVNFSFIPVISTLSVQTPMEAMNASAEVVTVVMEGYAMVHNVVYPISNMAFNIMFLTLDIDECATGLSSCPEVSTCHNLVGGYICGVPPDIAEPQDPGLKLNNHCNILV